MVAVQGILVRDDDGQFALMTDDGMILPMISESLSPDAPSLDMLIDQRVVAMIEARYELHQIAGLG